MQPEEQKAGTEERKYSLMALLSEHRNDYSILFISPNAYCLSLRMMKMHIFKENFHKKH